ncbi:hypothetical protein KZZ07_25215 [Mameliella sp. CS4]|uniref:hypothetical protein n=1 Tax=Mameliella sp. CS4 TaxID=2862329 RepID=UPI001C5E93E2|nr:hypothetical protein [Mameliella sp. CS4]MBW4985847.1 hypothetical protein [Mameliella sp. CS4]
MQVTVTPLLTAPQVTGHPQGLPEVSRDPASETRVKPIADARDPEAGLREGQAPAKFWRAANGEPDPDANTAPPSIMQITISRMLEEQAPRTTAPDATESAGGTGADPGESRSEERAGRSPRPVEGQRD